MNNNYNIALLGYDQCPACHEFGLMGISVNLATNKKYYYCDNCKQAHIISDDVFAQLLAFSRGVPQDETIIRAMWDYSINWYSKNVQINSKTNLMKTIDELGPKLFNELLSIFGNYNGKFISNIVNNSFDCYSISQIKSTKLSSSKGDKTKSIKNLEELILCDYRQSMLKIMNTNPDFFALHPIQINCIIDATNKKASILDLYGGDKYQSLPDEIIVIRLIHSLCLIYQFISNYKNQYPKYTKYEVKKKYEIDYYITANEVYISDDNGFRSFWRNDNLYAKVVIESFESILNLYSCLDSKGDYGISPSYAEIIKDFIKHEYYSLGIDIGLAIFLFKNQKYFKDYVITNENIKDFVNIIKKSKTALDLMDNLMNVYRF